MFRLLCEIAISRTARWLAGAAVTVLGIYGTFFYERKPDLSFETLSSSSVLDIRESLTKLAVVYDGTNLQATGQNLHLLVLRVVNHGSADILKSSFDDAAPLGFTVNLGKIVETPTVVASPYLQANLRITVLDERTVAFAPVILNAGESFLVRVLLLVPANETPVVTPTGKIAGVYSLEVSQAYVETKSAGYWKQGFAGGALIQVGRAIGYSLAMIFSIALVAFPISAWSERRDKSRRRARAERYRAVPGRRLSLKEDYLLKHYIDGTPIYRAFVAIAHGNNSPQNIPAHDFEAACRELECSGLIVRDGPLSLAPDFIMPGREFMRFLKSESVGSPSDAASE